ncbi:MULTISPECIES: hypothetical protein [unclassified Nocardioides]|uniref:hypothetical protein n=1 Tax=unclassified Nocardioides TaxID=2615069 RepID=UPI0006FA6DDF|nr:MULTISPECIES: hypothetical protein [unclassified Nocardioides]KRA37964.1 hypothetical protein ASD81_04575 [Nocardioides sp. Root614]KRA91924.1 hypothetical protein ASD84_04840 [Nocardioides sp. Root682]
MIDDDHYNAQGTFYFPAGFRNDAQYIAFWDTVAIPDRALVRLLSEQVQGLYRQEPKVAGSGSDVMRKLESMLERAALSPGEVALRENKWRISGHELLTQVLARPVARATGLVTYLPADLGTTARDRVLDHEFELGDGRWMSARSLVVRFKTLDLDFLRPS